MYHFTTYMQQLRPANLHSDPICLTSTHILWRDGSVKWHCLIRIMIVEEVYMEYKYIERLLLCRIPIFLYNKDDNLRLVKLLLIKMYF
jgi:hypothetical protein